MIYVHNRQLNCYVLLINMIPIFCYAILDLGCTYFNSKLNKIWHCFSKEYKHGTITRAFEIRF